MGKWVFEELRGAAVRRDPNEAALFKTEQTGEGEYLIRTLGGGVPIFMGRPLGVA